MADTVTKRYVYPPNWEEGNYQELSAAHAVSHRRYCVHLTNNSDGTGESSVSKVALENFLAPSGEAAEKFVVEGVSGVVYGMTVKLEFDRAPATTICVLGDSGTINFGSGIVDAGEGQTGDIILTTSGASNGDSYDIDIVFRTK